MYRNGAFTDLQWAEVQERHRGKWDLIESYFGFSKTVELSCGSVSDPLLYKIAESCVSECHNLLFSLIPVEYLQNLVTSHDDQPDFSKNARHLMESGLKTALCDHLVVSFAYRFFSENLVPRTISEYCDVLYHCRENSDYNGVRSSQTEARNNFRKNIKRMYGDFRKELGISGLDSDQTNEGQTILSTIRGTNDRDSFASFQHLLEKELEQGTLPPPSAWFILSFVPEKIKFRNIFEEESENYYVALTRFVREAKFFKALMTEERIEQELNDMPILYQGNESLYSAIPFDSNMGIISNIPAMTYKLQGETKTDVDIVVSERLQMIFNNYLFERNFHICALSTAEFVLRRGNAIAGTNCSYADGVLMLTNIHAPLLHSAFIAFLNNSGELQEKAFLLERYVKRWNRNALPVLEELFISRVKEVLKHELEVVDAINDWASRDAIYERANVIRAIRTDKRITDGPKNKQLKDFYNGMVLKTFSLFDNLQ